jgi:hyaluronoglucosaminidase
MNKELFKNFYHLNSFIYFSGNIGVFLTNQTIFDDEFFVSLINKAKFTIKRNNQEINLKVFTNKDILEDGYKIYIRKDKIVEISSSNKRGFIYAINAFNDLCEKTNSGFKLPILFIEDEPSFLHRGIIEGYYGTPWSFEEREDMVDFLVNNRLNSYIYAPKSDIYHRDKWCDPYPKEIFFELKKLYESLSLNDIEFYYTLSPGHIKVGEYAFDYTSKADFEKLYRKIDDFINIGVKNFGLLMDDIDYKVADSQKAKFPRPGLAHAYICNELNAYLRKKLPEFKMIMCPTEYHHIGESEYRNDLKENLDDNIIVFFTGDNVCAELITKNDLISTKRAYEKELFIWDNFPVSDFTYGVREFIAPIQNRYNKMHEYAPGYFINPSVHYHISKIGMQTMAEYAWNSEGYNKDSAFERALKSLGDDFYLNSKKFIEFNYPNVLSYGKLLEMNELVNKQEYEIIKDIYQDVVKDADNLLKLDLEIIKELKPWLLRVKKEEKIFLKIIEGKLLKEELLDFLEDEHFLGMEIIDVLIKKSNLLTNLEFEELITKRRGRPWYRIFEEKRWKK